MTLISVIMAAYNEANRVGVAIRSIQKQTWPDWELVVVDDGSTDGTSEELGAIAHDDPRVKVCENRCNLGLAASLNRALSLVRGNLVARMDGDDVSMPDRLSLQVTFLRDHPDVDVLGGGAIEVGDDGQALFEAYRREWHNDIVAHIYKENPFFHSTVMARCNCMLALGGYDVGLRRAQDYDLWLRGSARFRYHNLQTPLIRYRRRPTSFRNAAYSARVLWRSARRERRVMTHAWYALRPLLAAARDSLRQNSQWRGAVS